jgi:hypothetical protein
VIPSLIILVDFFALPLPTPVSSLSGKVLQFHLAASSCSLTGLHARTRFLFCFHRSFSVVRSGERTILRSCEGGARFSVPAGILAQVFLFVSVRLVSLA